METQRISLYQAIEPRDATLTKDGVLTNCYAEDNPEGVMIVKRGGISEVTTLCAGTGQGAYYFNGLAVFVACDTLVMNRVQVLLASVKAGSV